MPKINKIWLPTKEASKILYISPKTLRNRIKSGHFQRGVHFRNISPGDKPIYQFDIDAINKLYE